MTKLELEIEDHRNHAIIVVSFEFPDAIGGARLVETLEELIHRLRVEQGYLLQRRPGLIVEADRD